MSIVILALTITLLIVITYLLYKNWSNIKHANTAAIFAIILIQIWTFVYLYGLTFFIK